MKRSNLVLALALATASFVPVQAATAAPAAGIVGGTVLATFDTAAPTTSMHLLPITGLVSGDRVQGIDVRPGGLPPFAIRPQGGQLYALVTRDIGATDEGRIVTIDPGTGAATYVGGAAFDSTLADGAMYGVDFSPTGDRLRIVNDADQNMRGNPNNGARADLPINDSSLTPGDVVHAANDRSVPTDPGPGPTTTVWVIDAASNSLALLGGVNGTPSPNVGAVTPVGAGLGIDVGATGGFDIPPSATAATTGLLATMANGVPTLLTVNLSTGVATPIATLPVELDAFAILPDSAVQTAAPAIASSETQPTASVVVTRTGATTGTTTVDWATAGGTATAGSDFVATAGTLTFAPGETSRSIDVPVLNDVLVEGDEALTVTLTGVSGSSLPGAGLTTQVTITSDDVAPARDTTKPAVLFVPNVTTIPRGPLLRRGIGGRFSCNEACTARVQLKLGRTVLGTATSTMAAAGKRTFTVKLSAAGRRALARAFVRRSTRRVGVSLVASVRDGAGNTTPVTVRIAVTR